MTEPTFASVTEKPCVCSYLRRSADDSRLPIVFDPLTGEYHFIYRDAEENAPAILVIYHCPFCGGAAPKSKRELLFAIVSTSEQERLDTLLDGIRTLDDAIRKLGAPDFDNSFGITQKWLEQDGQAPAVESFRTLTYSGLSEIAELYITDYLEKGLHFRLQGKYVGPTVGQ